MSDTGLNRAIRLRHATAMVVGTIIGASIFVQPSEITGRVPTLAGAVGVWLAAGFLTCLGALVCAELVTLFPRSGGVYVYLKEAYGPAVGFLWGWAMFWTMHSGIIAAIAVVFARYAGFFVPLSPWTTRMVAAGAILIVSAINYVGVSPASRLQTIFTLAKVVAIVLMVIVAFVLGGQAETESLGSHAADVSGSGTRTPLLGGTLGDFLLALVAGLFAFGGWHMVTYSADETVDARRNIPRALAVGVLVVTLSYVALNAAYFHVLPIETVVASDRVAADAANAVLGFGGGALMSGLVVMSTFGALVGIILAGPRVYYAMSRDGLLFRWFGEVHPTYRTPHRAILAQAGWSAILVLTGTYRVLFTRVIYTEWIFFGLMAVGLLRVRRAMPSRRRAWAFGGPSMPVVFAVAAFAIVINQIVSDPVECVVGLSFVAAGWPVYRLWVGRRRARERSP